MTQWRREPPQGRGLASNAGGHFSNSVSWFDGAPRRRYPSLESPHGPGLTLRGGDGAIRQVTFAGAHWHSATDGGASGALMRSHGGWTRGQGSPSEVSRGHARGYRSPGHCSQARPVAIDCSPYVVRPLRRCREWVLSGDAGQPRWTVGRGRGRTGHPLAAGRLTELECSRPRLHGVRVAALRPAGLAALFAIHIYTAATLWFLTF